MASISKVEMRKVVAGISTNPDWVLKVARMSDNQVYAIYQSYIRRPKPAPKEEEQYHQMTIYEVFGKTY